MALLKTLACLILYAGMLCAAHATTITFSRESIGGADWRYRYAISNDSIGADINEFTIYFDRSRYANLVLEAAPGNWDTLLIQPDLAIPADGYVDALALVGGIAAGDTLGGLLVSFSYLGPGAPGAQAFDIVDANFVVIDQGVTTPASVTAIPEPRSLLLLTTGLAILGLCRYRRRATMLVLAAVAASSSAHAAPVVTGMQLIGEKRISRSVFDYTYRVTIRNDAIARRDVVARVGAVGAGTSIQEGTVAVGGLAANQLFTATDPITLRHDRLQPFSLSAVTWILTGTELPPEPGDPPGILLPGDPRATVGQAMPDHDASHLVADADISTDPNTGYRIIRTALYIAFRQDATVGEVNAILNAIDGRILSSFAGNGAVSVGIRDPGSLSALYALIADLRQRPAIESVLVDDIAAPEALPQQDYAANNLSLLDHHLGVRGAAAWNARGALNAASASPPAFLIYDTLGNGPPRQPFTQVVWQTPGAFGTGCNPLQAGACQHGYHVTGIALADFGGAGDLGQVTGIYPSGAPYSRLIQGHVIDNWKVQTGVKTRIRRMLESIPGKVVVNSSMSERLKCDTQTDDELAVANARFWLRLLRGANLAQRSALEDKYFHAAAAANNTCGGVERPLPGIVDAPGKRVAKYAASWTAASLLSDVQLAAPALTNTLAIENRQVVAGTAAPLAAAASPGCTYTGFAQTGTINGVLNPNYGASYTGGHVAGIGSRVGADGGVWSYLDAARGMAGRMAGTSMASPQVAGLALYLWTLRPELSGSQVAQIIKGNVTHGACAGDSSDTPVIDAYATILSADQGFGADLHPARLAILDVTQDGKFDEDDTQAFLDAIFASTAGRVADYSRHDLNGDGFTGGSGAAAVNLDMSYDAQGVSTYAVVTSAQNGFPLKLNEQQVTDFDVLCYYVYSELFPPGQLARFEQQLQAVRDRPGRANVTCARPVGASITLSDALAGWSGMPGTALLEDLRTVRIPTFQAFGNNNCLFGERGGPIFSSTVDADATFFAASTATNVPAQNFPAVNRRNCSSFVAYKNQKLWINASGRAEAFVGASIYDWEYQTRFFSDGATTTCRVGVVPNSGNFATTLTTSNCVGKLVYAPAQ